MRNNTIYNFGIDILKVFAMFLIIMVHIIGHGGILQNLTNSLNKNIIFIIYFICFLGVNIFAIISGFVGYRDNNMFPRYYRYIELWLQVAFYSFLIVLILMMIGLIPFNFMDIIKSVFPLTFNNYWYFSAYTGLFLIMPFLNFVINKMDKKMLLKLLLLCFITFCVYGVIGSRYSDPFKLQHGYSFIWISYLYIIGASIKKYAFYDHVRIKTSVKLILSSLILSYLWKFFIGLRIGHGFEDIFYSYISPLVVIIAISLVLLFAKININTSFNKMILFVSSSVFSVYLIHDHDFVRELFIKDKFSFISDLNSLEMVGSIIAIVLFIFIVGVLIDKIRILIFNMLHVRKFAKYLDESFNKSIDKFVNKCF